MAELSVEVMKQVRLRKPVFELLPKYPSVMRDLAFVVDEGVPASDVEQAIRASSGELLKSVRLFDLYVGDQLERGNKSCAFSLEFLSSERTLTEGEVERTIERIVQYVGQKFGAKLVGASFTRIILHFSHFRCLTIEENVVSSLPNSRSE